MTASSEGPSLVAGNSVANSSPQLVRLRSWLGDSDPDYWWLERARTGSLHFGAFTLLCMSVP